MRIKRRKNKTSYDKYILLKGNCVEDVAFVLSDAVPPINPEMIKVPKELVIEKGDIVIVEEGVVKVSNEVKKKPWWKF